MLLGSTVLGHFMLVLVGNWWDRINIGLVCLYTLKKKICQGVTDAGHTHTLRGKHSTELLSLKFKLSQATIPKMVFFYDEN